MSSPDVIIIGAGIIGSSIAWRLAQLRILVTLFDRGAMGAEASTAGAGMLAPGGEIVHAGPLAEMTLESLEAYGGFARDLQSDSGLAIDYRSEGALELAATAAEWTALQSRAAAQRALGIESAPAALPSPCASWPGALRFPADALVDPAHVMQALRAACEKHGVKIREGVPVAEVQARPGRVDVVTDRRVISCEAAVIAAGAWSSEIATIPPAPTPESEPVRGHLVSFRLPAGRLHGIVRHGHTYLLQRANGDLIAGTSQERIGFDRTLDPAAIADICRRASEIIPELQGREPDRAWLGFRPGLVDAEGPVLDRLPGSAIWRAYGHYRNGILLAPATATRIAAQIARHLRTA